MTPEEIEELRALVGRLNCTAYDENLAAILGAALEHIDQQAASLDEADALTKRNAELMNGYLARIDELETGLDEAVKVVRQNAGTISALRVQIAELESQILHQTAISACRIKERERHQKQIAALQEIAIEEGAYRAYYEANARTESYADFGYSLVANGLFSAARDRLAKEHPEAFG